MLELYVLASGSSGNASVVRDALTGRSVLVDCGITQRDFFTRCETLELDPTSIEAVLVTHAHTDHTKGLGVVLRGLAKAGCLPTVLAHPAVRATSQALREAEASIAGASAARVNASEDNRARELEYDQPVQLAGMRVLPFFTSHDVAASVGFRFQTDDDALGYMTDTGCVTPAAHKALEGVRILAIESNHDVAMLREGPYPYMLQERILSNEGHLSNVQCCEEVASLLHPGLEQVVAMHISEHNNTFVLPVVELQRTLEDHGHRATVSAGLPRTPIVVR